MLQRQMCNGRPSSPGNFQALRDHPRVKRFSPVRGMIWAFDVIDAPAGFSRRFSAAALEHELLLRPIGRTVYLMPPYLLDDDISACGWRSARSIR